MTLFKEKFASNNTKHIALLALIMLYLLTRDTTIQRMTIRRMLIERHFWLHC